MGSLFPSPGDLPNPGIKPRSHALQADSLSAEPQGKPGDHLGSMKKPNVLLSNDTESTRKKLSLTLWAQGTQLGYSSQWL